MNPIGFNSIVLGIDVHFWHRIVELHILLANFSTSLDSLNAFLEVIGFDCARGDARRRHKEDRGSRDEGCKHGTCNNGLDRGDGGIGIALCESLENTGGKGTERRLTICA